MAGGFLMYRAIKQYAELPNINLIVIVLFLKKNTSVFFVMDCEGQLESIFKITSLRGLHFSYSLKDFYFKI